MEHSQRTHPRDANETDRFGDAVRIVQLVCSHGYSGVERYMATLARGLQVRGFESVVIGGDGSAMQSSLEASGVQFLPGNNMSESLRSLYALGDVDIINCHMTQADLVALVGRMRHGARIVSTLHFARPRGEFVPVRLVMRWISRKYSAQIAISDFVKRRSREPATVILSGVASQPIRRGHRELNVLLAQRLEREKRTDFALHAWLECRARRDGWRLKVAGRGAEAATLSALAKQLGVSDTVDFLGFRNDMHLLFERVSILLAPAPAEPLGLSV